MRNGHGKVLLQMANSRNRWAERERARMMCGAGEGASDDRDELRIPAAMGSCSLFARGRWALEPVSR